jgi:hypothetical protein
MRIDEDIENTVMPGPVLMVVSPMGGEENLGGFMCCL